MLSDGAPPRSGLAVFAFVLSPSIGHWWHAHAYAGIMLALEDQGASLAPPTSLKIAPKITCSADLEPLYPCCNGNLISFASTPSPPVLPDKYRLTNRDIKFGDLSARTSLACVRPSDEPRPCPCSWSGPRTSSVVPSASLVSVSGQRRARASRGCHVTCALIEGVPIAPHEA